MTTNSEDRFPFDPKLIFMGTPEFAVPTLRALIHKEKRLLSVVTQPDRPKGRGKKMTASPVKQLAGEHGIDILQPEKVSDGRFFELIKAKEPDLIIVVAFGQILKRDLLSIPKWGVINIHASLLPKYRGAAPIQRALLNNESLTGLTVMRMDDGLDTGPIILQEEVPILENETAGQLHDRLALSSGDLIIRTLNQMAENPIMDRPQNHSKATYAPKIDRDMAKIDWNQEAIRIHSLIRSLDPRPGAYSTIGGKEIKLFSPRLRDKDRSDAVPGEVMGYGKEGLLVGTGKGLIEIGEMQYPGKRRLFSSDFLRGTSLPEGIILGR